MAEARSGQEDEQQEREATQHSRDHNRGELGVRREQTAPVDREAAQQAIETLTAEFEWLPTAEPPIAAPSN